METNEVSVHQVKVFMVVRNSDKWLTAKEIAELSGVAARTARHHSLALVRLGIFDQAEVFPGHRYRFSSHAEKRNKTYLQRLNQAIEIFNIHI